ncbi:MAG: hypothetical protein FWE32_10845 [Oscillospiraceae bacterium]|nr:hypothetical protein [Oscillospiraceae bacterium]
MIEKSLDSSSLSDVQMEKINRFTRRALEREEVFVFSLILCDSEIDRDFERFPKESLEVLSGLFVGKTGVFDHSPKAKNQSARIFDAALEDTGKLNSLGEPYCILRAYAYMLRSPKNEELIFEIDGGIKKEVSVGCAVERIVCSVCGADHKATACEHVKGGRYDDSVCHHRLENPTDAYEWSFVAVPAQKEAGVTKRAGALGGRAPVDDLCKLFEGGGGLNLTAGEIISLKAQYSALAEKAKAGDAYLSGLRGEVVRLAGFAIPELAPTLVGQLAAKLDSCQLSEMRHALRKAANKAFPPSPQLGGGDIQREAENPFVI